IPAHRPQDHITLEMAPLEIRHRSIRSISAKHAQASRFLQQSPQGCLDPAVLPERQFFVQQYVDGLDAIDFALLYAAQGGVEHLQGAWHFEMDQAAADIIDAGCGTPMVHGRSPRASWLPIA
ncbi:hypothetical protein, partial [Rhizorhabdus histidinilytica]|uniref:hypothetical protein n=1 Tax=Rhizorhabdus histidinilytica TaxID=439228 RepID=UPI001ADBBCF8